jgi:hypothetical protein
MMNETKRTKNEIKQETRMMLRTLFTASGCEIHEKQAGSVQYEAIGISGSDQRIAAIYGSRGGACALWVKDATWMELRKLYPETIRNIQSTGTRVQDVSMFARGFQWAIHFTGTEDPWIAPAVAATVNQGEIRWDKAVNRRATEQRRADERKDREAKMAEKRKDPFA